MHDLQSEIEAKAAELDIQIAHTTKLARELTALIMTRDGLSLEDLLCLSRNAPPSPPVRKRRTS